MKYKIVTFCLFILYSVITAAQNFSNKGTDFWITYPAHIDALKSVMGIYITSDANTSGTITVNGQSIPFSVTANTVTEKFIGSSSAADASNAYVYLSLLDGIKTGAAIHVVSDNPVVVYSHIIQAARSGATLVLPVSVWGREYVVPSYSSNKSSGGTDAWGYGAITIVAAETNTTVQITPVIARLNGSGTTPYQITLANPGDVYQVQFKQGEDISGTLIQSVSNGSGCKKIAVFSSTTWSAFGCNSSTGGDNLYQQLFPTGAWGKSFLTAPAKTRASDIIRVFVSDPTAVVTKTENGVTATLTGLVNHSFYEFTTGNPTFIQSSKTASVVQYFTTMACQNGAAIGDPEMIVINPVEQTINNITVFSAHQNVINAKFPGQSQVTNCFLNIIIKSNAVPGFKINNAPPNASFIAIPGTDYSYLQEDVTSRSLTNPVQNLKADSNFIAIAYGFGYVESYGYNAGTNVIDLSQGIIVKTQYGTTNEQATCTATPISFAAKFSYQPNSITWDFGNNTNLTPNAAVGPLMNPVADSTFTDPNSGKTIYVYKLTGVYNFTATGDYPIKVTAYNPTADGCSGVQAITYNMQVYAAPVTDFTFKTSGCATDSVKFNDLSNPGARPITKWIWDFNDLTADSIANPVKKFKVGGNYQVHLRTVTDLGCTSDTTRTVALSALPDMKFGVKDTTCVNGIVTFVDNSTIAQGSISTWYWSYGDGVKDTVFNNGARTHVYQTTGIDTVYLNLVTNTGCSEVQADYITIHPHPVPGFILPEVCLNDKFIQFADTSSIEDHTESQFTYQWNFNSGAKVVPDPDPLFSGNKNPSVQFKKADNYAVSVLVTSRDGCVSFLQKIFTVNGAVPVAGFSVLQPGALCSNDSVSITDLSTVNFGTITKVEIYWDTTSVQKEVDELPTSGMVMGTGKTYSHLYNNDQLQLFKKHYIRLVAYSGISCVSNKLDSITINQSPLVQFSVIPGICHDTTARQITQAVDSRAIPLTSALFKGAGISQSGLYSPQSVDPGTYTLQCLITSPAGCKDSASQSITVWPSPVARWGISAPDCERNSITFTDSSQANYSKITNRYWNFGDGNTLNNVTDDTFAKTYITSNTYNASLRVRTDSGCQSASNTQSIVVHPVPVVLFNLPAGICLPDGKGSFTDATTIADLSQSRFSYLWNFGDPADRSASTLQNPIHRYSSVGTYTVQLKVTSKDGCTDSLSQVLSQIYPQPKANFSAEPPVICVNDIISFTDLSKGITGDPVRWYWDLAGGYNSSLQNPSRRFTDSGTFIISLNIYNRQGCVSDTVQKEVTVFPYPKLKLASGLMVLEGGGITITPLYCFGNNLQYLWTPSSYLSSDTAACPKASPREDIKYKLELTGIGNCTVSDSVYITVLKIPAVPNAFSPNGDGINDTWSIRYLDSYPGCTVDVYDRYGQVVFHSVGYANYWDGRYKGVPLPVGTYYYIINPKNGRSAISGSVTIIR